MIVIVIAATAAAPSFHEGINLPALKHQDDRDELGQFSVHYITADGTERKETGRLVPTADGRAQVIIVDGEVSYIGDDGKKYTMQYSAGTNGYIAKGNHIPVAPVIPDTQ